MPSKAQLFQALEQSVEDIDDVHPNFKGMLYGPSGVGKTVLAVKMAQELTPKDKLILYLDSMEHWVSIQNHPELKDRVKRLKYEGLSQIDTIRDAIADKYSWFGNVGTVIIDEMDSIQGEDLDVVAQSSTETGHGPDDVTWPDYNKNTTRVRRVVRKFLKQDLNIIMVAHDGEGKDRRGVAIQRPDFTPKLAKVILEFVHVCGFMTSEAIKSGDEVTYKRLLQVHPTGNLVTKCRVGGLPVKVDEKQLINGIKEWQGGQREDSKSESNAGLLENEADADPGIVVED